MIYHTGDEKSAVGTATVVSVDDSDPKNPQVKIKAGKANAKPVTLAEAKANKLFADSPLARQGRLSVVPLTEAQFKFLPGSESQSPHPLAESARRAGQPLFHGQTAQPGEAYEARASRRIRVESNKYPRPRVKGIAPKAVAIRASGSTLAMMVKVSM